MVSLQVMAYDTAVAMAGASGILEINLYKPMMIFNLLQSVRLLTDSCFELQEISGRGNAAQQGADRHLPAETL